MSTEKGCISKARMRRTMVLCWRFLWGVSMFTLSSTIPRVSASGIEESYEALKGQIPQEMVIHRVISPSTKREGTCQSDDRFERTDLFLPLGMKDSPFAPFLFRSLELFMPCYGDLVILIEPQAINMVFSVIPLYAYVFVVDEPLPPQFGYLTQQFVKMYADIFTSKDYVLILETDLVQSNSAIREGYFDEQVGSDRQLCDALEGTDSQVPTASWKGLVSVYQVKVKLELWLFSKQEQIIYTPYKTLVWNTKLEFPTLLLSIPIYIDQLPNPLFNSPSWSRLLLMQANKLSSTVHITVIPSYVLGISDFDSISFRALKYI
ncbi:unnamed protein product, partial [Choristocarpus tenellus]